MAERKTQEKKNFKKNFLRILLTIMVFIPFREKTSLHASNCPFNAECFRKVEKLYDKWLHVPEKTRNMNQTLKNIESFRRGHGLPTRFYAKSITKKIIPMAEWDYPCKQERPNEWDIIHSEGKTKEEVMPFTVAEAFISATGKEIKAHSDNTTYNLPKDGAVILRPFLLVEKQKKKASYSFTRYDLSIDDFPLTVHKGKLIATRYYRGSFAGKSQNLFFHLSVNKKGHWKVLSKLPKDADDSHWEDIKCPAEFVQEYQKIKSVRKLYTQYICKRHKEQVLSTITGVNCL